MGIIDRSGEVLIGTDGGVVKCRTVRRKAGETQRWDMGAVNAMKGLPWEPEPGIDSMQVNIKLGDWTKAEVGRENPVPEQVKERKRVKQNDCRRVGFFSVSLIEP